MYMCIMFFAFSGFSFVAFFLQYFDTVGWIFWPVKTVSHITYTVLAETLNPAQSNPMQSSAWDGNCITVEW